MREKFKFLYKLAHKFKKLPNSWRPELEKIMPNDAKYEEVFGSEDGIAAMDWRNYYPTFEQQGFADCVSFSRNNSAEFKAIKEQVKDPDGNEFNLSDLDIAVGSGTTEQGNSMRAVSEYARTKGVSLEKDCPYTFRWGERQSNYLNALKKPKYTLGNYSWVIPNNQLLKSALQDSPVQIAIGVGWNYNIKAILKDPKEYEAYHAVVLTHIDEDGNRYIYDSYDLKEKILDKDYQIMYALSFRDLPNNWRGIGVEDTKLYQRLIGKLIIRSDKANGGHGEVYRVFEQYIQKVNIQITDTGLFNTIQEMLNEKRVFVGVSEKDYKRLENVAFTMQGVKKEELSINAIELLNN